MLAFASQGGGAGKGWDNKKMPNGSHTYLLKNGDFKDAVD